MRYRHRWYYVIAISSVLCLAACWLDFLPRCASINNAHREEKLLQTKIASLPADAAQIKPASINQQKILLSEIVQRGAQSSVDISEITHVANKQHFTAHGSYASVYHFISQLLNENKNIAEFTFQQINNDEVRLVADLLPSYAESHHNHAPKLFAHNPFCGHNSLQTAANVATAKMATVLLADMRLVGCLQQGQRRVAWLKLPDQSLIDVEEDAIIAKERVSIRKINNNSLTLMFPDHRQTLLRM